jgi:hypothetical protein
LLTGISSYFSTFLKENIELVGSSLLGSLDEQNSFILKGRYDSKVSIFWNLIFLKDSGSV